MNTCATTAAKAGDSRVMRAPNQLQAESLEQNQIETGEGPTSQMSRHLNKHGMEQTGVGAGLLNASPIRLAGQVPAQLARQKTPTKLPIDLTPVVQTGAGSVNLGKYEVYMRCVTWTKESRGLFDYESKNITKKNIKTHTGGRIILSGDAVQLVSRNHACNP